MPVKVLLVGSQQEVVGLIQDTSKLLQWCEVVVLNESSGAVELIEKVKFDGIIVQSEMPPPDGFELTAIIRKSKVNAGVPVFMLSDHDDIDTLRKGFKAGVTFFMNNPSNRERVYGLFNSVRGAMTSERRRHIRLPYHTEVSCTWGKHQEKSFTGESITIGEGGMSLKPSGGLEANQEVALLLTLPDATELVRTPVAKPQKRVPAKTEKESVQPSRLRAVVRYRKSAEEIGVEFLSLPPECRETIQGYINGIEKD